MTTMVVPASTVRRRTASSNPRIGGEADERDFVGYMENLGLPHPKKIDIAIPANCRVGRPEDDAMPVIADWGPVRQTYAGLKEVEPQWVAEKPAHRPYLRCARARRV